MAWSPIFTKAGQGSLAAFKFESIPEPGSLEITRLRRLKIMQTTNDYKTDGKGLFD
jgi:hypothetical protein